MTSVAQLYALQEIDLALDAGRAALTDITSRLGEAGELEEARAALHGRQEELRAAEKRFKEREFEADELRRKIEPLEARLYQGTVVNPKELADLQRDIDSLKRRRDELEDRALEAMEALEQVQQACSEAQRRATDLDGRYERDQAELRLRQAGVEHEISGLEAERAELAAAIDAALLRLYDQLSVTRQRRAVAKVEGGACQGCRISLPMSVLQRARNAAEPVQCSSCERILYVS
jgi:hypothetical protein